MSKIADILNDSTEERASPSSQFSGNGGIAQGAVAETCRLPHLLRRLPQDLNPVPLTERDAQRNSSQQLPLLQAAEPFVPPHSASSSVTPVAESKSYTRSQSSTPSSHAGLTTETFSFSYANSTEADTFHTRYDPASGPFAWPILQEDPSATVISIDLETASKAQQNYRARNAVATQRSRNRKKQIKTLNTLIESLQQELNGSRELCQFYQAERNFYVDLIHRKFGSHHLLSRPPTPGR